MRQKGSKTMFGKKETKLTGYEAVFQRDEIDFIDFKTYCSNFTTNGDWVIPLGSFFSLGYEYEEGFNEDTKEFMETYDDDLIMVFRHQDEKLVRKNVKMLGDKDPSNKGLYGSILKFLDGLEKTIERFPEKKVASVCDKLRELYDKKMSDLTTGQQTEIHIWIPVWRTTCEKALIVSVIGRINLIIT